MMTQPLSPLARSFRLTRLAVFLVLLPLLVVSLHPRRALPQSLSAASPCVIRLAPDPSGRPVIAPAIARAPSGCTIRLAKGAYREIVSISKPLTLEGEDGAILDPSEPFSPVWTPVPEFGPGVYRAPAALPPASLMIDGKLLAQVNPDRKDTAPGAAWDWKRLLASGMPLSGFRFIRGLWLYLPAEKSLFVHLENNAAPSSHRWSILWSREPIVTLHDTHDASVRHLALAHGYNGIAITGGCLRCSVTRSLIGPWDINGVMIRGGASESLVEENEIFRGSWEDWTPRTAPTPQMGLMPAPDWYEVWQIHKLAGYMDRVGVSITLSGSANRIRANRIHDVFDGIDLGEGEIESLDSPPVDPAHDRGAEISDNIIERAGDSGIEVGGPAVGVLIHHNTLLRTLGGIRYKLPRIGPVFIYRNILVDGSPHGIWYSMDDSPAEGYVYHNTVVGARAGLAYTRVIGKHKIGTPRWHYLNNLVVAETGFFRNHPLAMAPNFFADYNVTQGQGRPFPSDPAKDSHSLYLDDLKLAPGFPPTPLHGSPAIDSGLDLSTFLNGKPLPGCPPGYFQGKAPDAGAIEVE